MPRTQWYRQYAISLIIKPAVFYCLFVLMKRLREAYFERTFLYICDLLVEHKHILEQERLAVHCDVLSMGGMLNERC